MKKPRITKPVITLTDENVRELQMATKLELKYLSREQIKTLVLGVALSHGEAPMDALVPECSAVLQWAEKSLIDYAMLEMACEGRLLVTCPHGKIMLSRTDTT